MAEHQEELKIAEEIWLGYDRTVPAKDVELERAKKEQELEKIKYKELMERVNRGCFQGDA